MFDALAYHRQWRKENPEKVSAAVRKWQKAHPEKVRENAREWRRQWSPEKKTKEALKKRNASFKRKYGLTLETYDTMLTAQGGRCALCPRTPSQERYKHLNVDHSHTTGKVRGLLCTPCNHALDMLGDNEEGLRRAAEYCHE